jgi:glycosyltransferase involved in cell wall biosynthesis
MVEFSILIPLYNSESTIEKTLISINLFFKRYKKNCEIVIIDDASSDNSKNIVKNYFKKSLIKIIYFRCKKHKGVGYVRNLCIRKSTGKYLLFIDSDVFIKNIKIDKIIKLLEKYDIIYPITYFDNGKIKYPVLKSEFKYCLNTSIFIIKRDSLNKLDSLFDENLEFGFEDLEFFLRCNLFKLKSKFLSSWVALHATKIKKDNYARFYGEIKGMFYTYLKLRPFLKRIKLKHKLGFMSIFKYLICVIFNFNFFDRSSYTPSDSNIKNIKTLLFEKHSYLIKASLWIRLKIFFSALIDAYKKTKTFKYKIKK